MSLLIKNIITNKTKHIISKNSILYITQKNLSFAPSIYDGDKDPAPKFFSSNVQKLLKRLTRPDYAKVFRKRTNVEQDVLETPKYKFLTDEELEAEMAATHIKADRLLQMPPVVKVQTPINDVISEDPALIGYDTAKYMFTDITFGVDNAHRIIVERDVDGTLRSCDHDVRKRLNQVYFPMNGRKIREPLMFSDLEKLERLLDSKKYEFVLDRACIQYEPAEPTYQKITSITYQHVDMKSFYDMLRSTRHFGPLVFYLTWHQSMDGLLLEMLQTEVVREAALLVALRHAILGDVVDGNIANELAQQILSTPVQLKKQTELTEEDIRLDNRCIEVVEKYIVRNSSMRGQQELALQGFREHYQQLVELSRGLKKAHGTA